MHFCSNSSLRHHNHATARPFTLRILWCPKTTFQTKITQLLTPKCELRKIFWWNKQEFKGNERVTIIFSRNSRTYVLLCMNYVVWYVKISSSPTSNFRFHWWEGDLIHFLHHLTSHLDRHLLRRPKVLLLLNLFPQHVLALKSMPLRLWSIVHIKIRYE